MLIAIVVVLAVLFAGCFRVEIDPLAARPQRRVGNELIGFGLVGAVIASIALWSRAFPGPHPITKDPAIVGAGVDFLLLAALLISSYFVPKHNSVFRVVSTLWENAPGPTGGRSGLLFLGTVFGLVGLCLLTVGSGIVG
jgi:hypothetical protein